MMMSDLVFIFVNFLSCFFLGDRHIAWADATYHYIYSLSLCGIPITRGCMCTNTQSSTCNEKNVIKASDILIYFTIT